MKASSCSLRWSKGNLQLSHILLGDSLPWGGFGLSDTMQGEWEQALCSGMGTYQDRNWWDTVVGLQGSALGWFVSGVVSSASLGGNLGVPESFSCCSPNKRSTLDFHPSALQRSPLSTALSRTAMTKPPLATTKQLGHVSSFLTPAIPWEINAQPPAQNHQHFICAESRGRGLGADKTSPPPASWWI